MTADPETQHVLAHPEVIPAKVSIEHLQLRDLLQPSSSEGKCLIVNRLTIAEVDFSNPEQGASHFETLAFRPNCLVTGNGIVAAGGQQSELFICPLPHQQEDCGPSSLASTRDWKINTTTGGSINNSISIVVDSQPSSSSSSTVHRPFGSWTDGSLSKPSDIEPRSRAKLDEGEAAELEIEAEGWAAARGISYRGDIAPGRSGHTTTTSLPRHAGNTRKTFDGRSDEENEERPTHTSKKGKCNSRMSKDVPPFVPAAKQVQTQPKVQLFVSNNDRSLKLYDVRTSEEGALSESAEANSARPTTSTSTASSAKATRSETLDFPTAINHSSLSPDGSTLIVVGDTPQVFVYQRQPNKGSFVHLATYQASSEASFSTTWHPDGSKFAVASQDGRVSVWDVRSNKKLAELHSSQSINVPTGFGLLGSLNGAAGAVRTVKFSPCGRYIAFTEHRKFFHVYDTETFQHGQRIFVPSTWVRKSSGSSAGSSSSEQRSRNAPAHFGSLDHASLAAEQQGSSSSTRAPPGTRLSVQAWRAAHNQRQRSAEMTGQPSSNTRTTTDSGSPGQSATSARQRYLDYRSAWQNLQGLDTAGEGSEDPSSAQEERPYEERSLSPGDVQLPSESADSSSSSDDSAEHVNSAIERMRERYRGLDTDPSSDLSAIRTANLEMEIEDEAERAFGATWGPLDLRGPRQPSDDDSQRPTLRAYSALLNRGPQFGAFGPGASSHGVSLGTGSNATHLRLGRMAAASAAAATAGVTSDNDVLSSITQGRSPGFWPFSRDHPQQDAIGDPIVNIAGMCWDPNSKYIYVATEKMVCRYEMRPKLWSYPHAEIR